MIAKSEIPNIFVVCACAFSCSQYATAQFHTITKQTPVTAEMHKNITQKADVKENEVQPMEVAEHNFIKEGEKVPEGVNAHGVSGSKSQSDRIREGIGLPELTIPNLIEEIRRNGIKYPKIVLAQAILETGWFKSSVCRNKHNLFGLTNPVTGEYYEFSHWTESVRAYYTKVQYRYKGGNYLLWLKKIGYAEDPGYIRAVIRVLRML